MTLSVAEFHECPDHEQNDNISFRPGSGFWKQEQFNAVQQTEENPIMG